jgi:hypothetical protein
MDHELSLICVLRFSGSKILWYILPYLLIYSARLDVRLLVMSLMPAAESKTSPSPLMKKWRQEVFLLYLVRFSFAQVAAVEDSKPKILFSPGGIRLAGAGYPVSAPFASLLEAATGRCAGSRLRIAPCLAGRRTLAAFRPTSPLRLHGRALPLPARTPSAPAQRPPTRSCSRVVPHRQKQGECPRGTSSAAVAGGALQFRRRQAAAYSTSRPATKSVVMN